MLLVNEVYKGPLVAGGTPRRFRILRIEAGEDMVVVIDLDDERRSVRPTTLSLNVLEHGVSAKTFDMQGR